VFVKVGGGQWTAKSRDDPAVSQPDEELHHYTYEKAKVPT
jgi:hypothetical protein